MHRSSSTSYLALMCRNGAKRDIKYRVLSVFVSVSPVQQDVPCLAGAWGSGAEW
ncbi:hypothetical protein E2C01_071031 [Portunus trituberculatus]|uniref:Uncharacterized protein n=1 Tax=Portunus trituberculatus TaxID=210409 RepID=A0A5B7I730_PORTR|nr:hypothetical protein [Portunus trituberculatus]